jgi:hypothetical protein
MRVRRHSLPQLAIAGRRRCISNESASRCPWIVTLVSQSVTIVIIVINPKITALLALSGVDMPCISPFSPFDRMSAAAAPRAA